MGYERNTGRYGGNANDRGGYYGQDRNRAYGDYGREDTGRRDQGSAPRDYRGDRFDDTGRRAYGGDPRGYGDDRGFFDRAGDEVRSWFGDEEAERRRREDERRYGAADRDTGNGAPYGSYRGTGMTGDDGAYGNSGGNWGRERPHHDPSYRSWRDRQVQSFDQDYDEYRRENQSRFDREFHSWRQGRQGQRDLLAKVREHQDVVGSDGAHVGTVDHVRGDRIELTKSDEAAGGRHHTIPSAWIQAVDEKVTLAKTADQAHQHWRDEQRDGEGGLFGRNESQGGQSRYFDRTFGGR